MPRKPRESSGTGIYHVMLRGINRQDIFENAEDYWTFIRMIAIVANQGNQGDRSRDSLGTSDHGPVPLIRDHGPAPLIPVCHIYAYCLMPITFTC